MIDGDGGRVISHSRYSPFIKNRKISDDIRVLDFVPDRVTAVRHL